MTFALDTHVHSDTALFDHACIISHPCYGNLKIRDHEHASSGKKSIG